MAAGSLPLIRPMLATLGELPTPPGWGYEFKWDESKRVPRFLNPISCEPARDRRFHGYEYVESSVVAEAKVEIAHCGAGRILPDHDLDHRMAPGTIRGLAFRLWGRHPLHHPVTGKA